MNDWKTVNLTGGDWKVAFVLDIHTLKSIPLGEGLYDTTRTELGKLIHEIKYNEDKKNLEDLVNKVFIWIKKNMVVMEYLEGIIPVPPSNTERSFQPVFAIAEELSKKLKIPFYNECLIKIKKTPLMKEIPDDDEKRKILRSALKLKNIESIRDKKILLFDDIIGTGSTLKECTNILVKEANVKIYALAITRRRTKGSLQL